jgi:nucleotide-binding universal stress UspA family protein
MFKHLLVANDFSPPAMTAAAMAQQIAGEFGSKVTLINIYDPASESRETALEHLTVLREERFASVADVELAPIGHRHAEDAICGHAIAVRADLVVAGRHGHHDLGERLIGSTTERIVRHAPCSVLVAEPTRRDTLAVAKHVVACTDFSEGANHAIGVAGGLARKVGAWVTLVHVYDLVPSLHVLMEPREAHDDHSFDAVIEDKLQALQKEHLEGLPSSTAVLRDKNVVTGIVDFTNDKQADLVVVSTRGRTGVARMLLGSVAERVVRHASAHVLVVR